MNLLQVDLSAEPCPKDTLIRIAGMRAFAMDYHPNLLEGLRAALWLAADLSIEKGNLLSRITILNYDPDRKILEVRIS